ncbi:HAMP domain-containing sensor histidine kinase [Hymenobacter sp. M29]|uniref:histidine kinase n=1 Tax=Hymenobacter mellowenesis TaxID=3063995 RepID=A0ABT9A8E2_9BACT|nr:HAMP domain-containing sensor histidine kinase [Hymenobacter sp. M29]MDO7845672.1 HAMP domain-containing sensor histidine kinase [Hymenobacter sp. M29]
MKSRIRSIFWLLALCILGINGFQAYWLYNTYQLANEQFTRTTNEALLTVVLQQQFAHAGLRKFSINISDGNGVTTEGYSIGARPTRRVVTFSQSSDSSGRDLPASDIKRIVVVRRPPGSPADSARQRRPLHFAPDSAAMPSLTRLAAAYRAELRRRDTDADFVLDTVDLRTPTDGYGPRIEAPPAYTLHTRPVSLDLMAPGGGNLKLQASFRQPTFYILRRMGGLLGGSVALLALTTGCFMLMLSTILKQRKLSEVKNDFINNMTHELKTPLATVSAAVEALQNFGALNDPARTQTYLNISRTELQRLSDLVEKVLNIAVDERQPLELQPEPVHPAALVADIVARHQLQAPKPVTFDVQVPPADVVQLDKLHMGNVLNNLIDNAIKYSGAAVTVTIRSRQDATGWHLSVADDGPGIEPGYQAAIFDQFFRVPTGNLHNVKGFGLGLYYVRQVVERHGGRITVHSEPGRGSRFEVWIPQE